MGSRYRSLNRLRSAGRRHRIVQPGEHDRREHIELRRQRDRGRGHGYGDGNWKVRNPEFDRRDRFDGGASRIVHACDLDPGTQRGSGGHWTSTVTVTPKSGFTGTVALTATGLPAGVTASFNPASTATTSVGDA